MKTKIFIVLAFLSLSIAAQEFSGKAIYKTSRKSNMSFGDNQNGMTDEMKEQLKQRMAKMHQKTYILNFNKSESTYKQDVGLAAPKKPQAGGVMVFSFGGRGETGVLYKDIKGNRISEKTDIQGKAFLVKDELVKYEWKMTGETKNIGNYTCYKATYEKEIKRMNMSVMSFGRGDKKTKDKDDDIKEEEKMEKLIVTAWYTPDIPVNNGPENYWGLPGLILEINDGTQTIVCTEIVLNPSKKIEIEEPKGGKVVDRKKFGEIQKKKTKEMMEKFKGRDGLNINGLQIKTGG